MKNLANKYGAQWCISYIKGWATSKPEDISISPLGKGLTNFLYVCANKNTASKSRDIQNPKKVLLRVYGGDTSSLFDRSTDNIIFTILSERKIGPYLYASFEEGRIEQYIESTTLMTEDIRTPLVSAKIARMLAGYHQLDMPLKKSPSIGKTLESFLAATAKVKFENKTKENLLAKIRNLINPEEEAQFLTKLLASSNSPLVFCHNDLQELNILRLGNAEGPIQKDDVLRFIDYEYAGYNYRCFDFGNHFCEWVFDYSNPKYPFFYERADCYPTAAQQTHFFKEYLRELDAPAEAEVLSQMLYETNIGMMASHFVWGLWSTIQAELSEIEFGYLEYGLSRFEHYLQAKEMLLKEACKLAHSSLSASSNSLSAASKRRRNSEK
eukprot:Sdes_comp18568_c0_seq1m8673